MAYTGRFKPKHPEKYMGDPKQIIWRSTWECKTMTWFDNNPDIVQWSSEELIIPYISPVDSRQHRYFPDFVVKIKKPDGTIKTMVVEVKPEKQTKEPEVKKRVTKQYLQEVMTYGVNQAKWNAAKEFCSDRGWEFIILTEKHLGI